MEQTPQRAPEVRRSLWRAFDLRTLKYSSHASLFTAIVLALAVLLYAMAVQHNYPFDVTQLKRFTLADQSIKLLRGLQQPIKIVAFFRLEAPEREVLADLLKLYVHHTDKLTYEFVDPDRHPALAKRYNITVYNTVLIEGYGKEEKIVRLEEEALTNAIVKLTRVTKKVVYFTTGHGEPALTDTERNGYSLAKQRLEEQNYDVKDLMLVRQQQVPEEAAVVIVADPRTDLLASELEALQAYLKRGGHLLLMLDHDTTLGLIPFLRQYGLELGHDVVIEPNALGRLVGGDYHMPAVTMYEEHPITRGFGAMMTIFPVVRSVVVAEALPEGVRAQALASTSVQSWAETDLQTLEAGRSAFDAQHDRQGPISIAAVVTLSHATAGPDATATERLRQESGNDGPSARLVVFGDAEFANNNYFTLQGNGDLFLNTVSWLAEEEDLIAIRPREGGGSGPVILTAAQAPLGFWLPVVVLPVAVLACGAVVCFRRRWQQ